MTTPRFCSFASSCPVLAAGSMNRCISHQAELYSLPSSCRTITSPLAGVSPHTILVFVGLTVQARGRARDHFVASRAEHRCFTLTSKIFEDSPQFQCARSSASPDFFPESSRTASLRSHRASTCSRRKASSRSTSCKIANPYREFVAKHQLVAGSRETLSKLYAGRLSTRAESDERPRVSVHDQAVTVPVSWADRNLKRCAEI